MNKKVLKTCEYDKIINMLVEEADSPLGKDKAARLRPSSDIGEITAMQAETSHALNRIFHNGALYFNGLTDIRPFLTPLEKGGTLGISELLRVSALLACAKRATDYDAKEEGKDFLSGRFEGINPLPDIYREINRCIISEDEISDDASGALKSIRRQIKTTNDKIREQLTKEVNAAGDKLRDSIITMRNGRYCLPVRQEYKSAVPGMIHDQSSTGSTFFIEPMAIVKLNNDLAELAIKEKEEIDKILAAISALCAPEAETLERNVILLAELDFIFAKGKLSKKMQASEPNFSENYIEIKKGRHPLIPRDKVVPIDVTLGRDYKLLIVTGPNTGGKTVSLKTVGLFTLMGQAGLHIPAFDGSHLCVFEEVYADIGDEQSIEQSLSTFSSHMSNTVYILNRANKRTLALFDELGAGTDPVEGAALAISILDNLLNRGVTAMSTTHYSELKEYALRTKNVENASCEFDVEKMQPTYKLIIGVPGKSNAFTISRKLGLSKDIIDHAKGLVNEDARSFEDVIASLDKTRKELEIERQKAANYRDNIERQKKNLEAKNERIDNARERILKKANDEANEILQKAKDFADESIRKYNKWMNSAGPDMSVMEAERAALRAELDKTETKSAGISSGKKPKKAAENLAIGDVVMVHSMGIKGTVSTLPNSKGNLFVQMGIMRSEVNISDLEFLEDETKMKTKEKNKERSEMGKLRMSKSMSVTSSINLIGKTVDEAIPLLDKYLDDAYLAKLSQVTIIHGVGTGALRNAVQAHCRKQKNIATYRLGEYGEGGYGVTIVEFK
ncbi:MAG: endonuclease MutS2 [Eubacterium sp.]|nr:endonuclease MutS2 [Eubacterium sp.]